MQWTQISASCSFSRVTEPKTQPHADWTILSARSLLSKDYVLGRQWLWVLKCTATMSVMILLISSSRLRSAAMQYVCAGDERCLSNAGDSVPADRFLFFMSRSRQSICYKAPLFKTTFSRPQSLIFPSHPLPITEPYHLWCNTILLSFVFNVIKGHGICPSQLKDILVESRSQGKEIKHQRSKWDFLDKRGTNCWEVEDSISCLNPDLVGCVVAVAFIPCLHHFQWCYQSKFSLNPKLFTFQWFTLNPNLLLLRFMQSHNPDGGWSQGKQINPHA